MNHFFLEKTYPALLSPKQRENFCESGNVSPCTQHISFECILWCFLIINQIVLIQSLQLIFCGTMNGLVTK